MKRLTESLPGTTEFGVLLLDKPAGLTSHDLVAQARRQLRQRRVGHAGTLDPAATGLMLLGVGRATRLLTWLVGADKTYLATMRFGCSTTTDDAQGEPRQWGRTDHLTEADITAAFSRFRGPIRQVPSTISAVKVDGVRAYKRARAGDEVDLAERAVTIYENEITGLARGDSTPGDYIDVHCRVRVSSGTYVRALARDIGSELGCGGHLRTLRRTQIGPFCVTEAQQLSPLQRPTESSPGHATPTDGPGQLARQLLAPSEVAQRALPTVIVSAPEAAFVCSGRRITADADHDATALLDAQGQLLAIATAQDGLWRYKVVFCAGERSRIAPTTAMELEPE
ncbi:MAG: tRNA pseudouridine(55) synthase TruB [Actinomycetia bacterium]|nr:tRNA pseudouridine(55) synthase TruB [Actinomycetes bacterium]